VGVLSALGGLVSGAGSIYSAVSQKNAQQANLSAEQQLDSQLEKLYNTQIKQANELSTGTNTLGELQQAGGVYSQEAAAGLSPQTIAAANANLAQQEAQGLSNLKYNLGPSTPNLAGQIKQYEDASLSADVNQNIQLAGENQAAKNEGAAGLGSLASGVLSFMQNAFGGAESGISGLAKQFGLGAAGTGTNPLGAFGSFLASIPALTNSNSTGTTSTPSTATPTTTTTTTPNPWAGFGWAGTAAANPDLSSGSLGQPAPGALGANGYAGPNAYAPTA
jgi:hypothetical protein